ncbi:hypothetical protein [Coxiella endosymbiont of Ornithodoros amblus]|uniref:hypothetical protein n=1 Tax=Coxiella endosymbiont of Ornithodoros amblus TaxID=1656166 RepID=UPI00244E2BF0|nr:hypothetical protein [Coxiella endosymbiont of Ornithodoros amblus]
MQSLTYAYNFVGKFMVQLGRSGIRDFANAGAAFIHRHDFLVNGNHINPTFWVGLNRIFQRTHNA